MAISEGYNAPFFWKQAVTAGLESVIEQVKTLSPKHMRFPGGEVAQDFDANSVDGNIELNAFITACKALRCGAILVLDCYHIFLGDQYSARSQASNYKIYTTVKANGIPIHLIDVGNEFYSKPEISGWPKPFTTTTTARKNAMAAAVTKYYNLNLGVTIAAEHKSLLSYQWATDQNAAHKYWNEQIMKLPITNISAHIYPSPGVTGSALTSLINKRIGRAKTRGFTINVTETNAYFGFTGDDRWDSYNQSEAHLAMLAEMKTNYNNFGVQHVSWHKLGGNAGNPYDFIPI